MIDKNSPDLFHIKDVQLQIVCDQGSFYTTCCKRGDTAGFGGLRNINMKRNNTVNIMLWQHRGSHEAASMVNDLL